MAGVNLPNDVILNHILTRVPASSANRFKCVSKQWNLFLSSDIFKEMHDRNKLNQQENHKLFFISKNKYTSPFSFYTIDCEAPHKKVPCSRPLPLFEAAARQICDIASGHGLVCLFVYPDIILWNPLTTEYKKLSRDRMDDKDWYNHKNGGLYYSSCEDDYKLVLVARDTGNAYIYSLKSDSWRMVTNIKLDGYWKLCVSLNDISLYILSENEKKAYSIVKFDTTTETFKKMETPSVNDNNKPHSATITVYRGCVHYCVKYDIGRRIELWKLNADVWKKVVSYDLILMPDEIRPLSPLHLIRNGNCLMIDYKDGYNLFEVDLKKKKYIKSVVGMPRHIRYTETFVSPNQYMK